MPVKRFAMVALVLTALTTAACGGGGGGGSAPLLPSVTPTSTASAAASGTTLSTSGAAVAASNVSGITSALTIAGSGSVNATETASAPVGFAAISAVARKASTQSLRSAASANVALVYVAITATAATSISGFPAATFTFATAPSGSVYLAYYNGSAWVTLGSAGTVSGDSVTFAGSTFAAPIALAANSSLFIAVYTGGVLAGSPTPVPSATVSASPAPVTSGTPFPTGTANPNLSNVVATFFSTIVPNGSNVVLSAWDLSSTITMALELGATNGHNVTVITPYSEHSSNVSDVNAIIAAGGHAVYEYVGSSPGANTSTTTYVASPMDIHAKFAVIDGVAYMDGHNWFTTDVILKDTDSIDVAAIQSDLNTFPTPATNGETSEIFTTDKQVSLQAESTFIQNVVLPAINDGAADEYDFITESFNPNNASGDYNDDVYIGMCEVASSARQPILRGMFEEESDYSSSAQSAIKNLGLIDPNAVLSTESSGGLEKISMIRKGGVPLAAWFGSSNATTTDLFDWGMVIYDPTILSALSTYYNAVPSNTGATSIAVGTGTATACGTIHS